MEEDSRDVNLGCFLGEKIVARLENPYAFRDLQRDVAYIILADSKEHREEIARKFADRSS